jgi:hypothetical protein
MLISLEQVEKIDSSKLDENGRLVPELKFTTKELLINPDHVVSVNEEQNRTDSKMCRIETTRGTFTVIGTTSQVKERLSMADKTNTRRVLKD